MCPSFIICIYFHAAFIQAVKASGVQGIYERIFGASKMYLMHLSTTHPQFRSKVMVLLLLIHCLLLLPLFVGIVFGHGFAIQYLVSFLVLQSSCLGRVICLLYSNCLPEVSSLMLYLFNEDS